MSRPQIEVEFEKFHASHQTGNGWSAPISPIRRGMGSTSPLSGASVKWEQAFSSAHERYGQRAVGRTPTFGLGERRETKPGVQTEFTTQVSSAIFPKAPIYPSSPSASMGASTRDAEYKVLHPVDKHMKADCATYIQPSSLMKQPLSTKRSSPSPTLSTSGARIASHRAGALVAARSPGSIYKVKSTLRTDRSIGFGHGSRFAKDPKSTSPGPASISLKPTMGTNSRRTSMKSRRSWNVRARAETNTDSPGPADIVMKSTVGLARASSLCGRDAWLDAERKMASPTSALRQLSQARSERTLIRRSSPIRSSSRSRRGSVGSIGFAP